MYCISLVAIRGTETDVYDPWRAIRAVCGPTYIEPVPPVHVPCRMVP
jgi:hypothetical protein